MSEVEVRPAPRQKARNLVGRPRIPHPFRDLAKEIIGRSIDGRPAAAVYRFAVPDEGPSLATLRNRFRRQLTRLGKEMRPERPYVFPLDIEQGERPGEFRLLFWERQSESVTPSR
jgi:hypothetical protein